MKAMPLTGVRQFEHRDDYPEPSSGHGRTVVRVSAVGLNRLDSLVADGELGVPLPHICGADVVGVVVQCDSGRHEVGTRVLINPALPQSGDSWPSSRKCAYVRILGAHVDGGMAEYLSVGDDQIYPAPAGLDDVTATTIPLDYLTAWRMLMSRAHLSSGEAVLVWGAAGPLGCAAIRICEMVGAAVVAVGSRRDDAQQLQAIGASSWLDYSADDFAERLKATAGDGFDVVFESVGRATWEHSVASVAQSGRIVISGVTSGHEAVTDLEDVYYKQVSILGSRMGYPGEFEDMLSALNEGRLKPGLVAETFGMRDAEAALASIIDRKRPGKVVLRNDL